MKPAMRHRMLSQWLAGELAPMDAPALCSAARSDPALLRDLAILRQVERLLRHHGTTSGMPDAFADEVLARLRAKDAEGRRFCSRVIARIGHEAGASRPPRRDLSWMRQWGAWAAVFLILLGLVSLLARREASQDALATVAGAEAIRWADGQVPLVDGQKLCRGRIGIKGGFLKIRFLSGASVIFEGPARLDVIGPNKVRLHAGRAAAEVPPAATGFTIESPDGRIIDVGTRFGIQVDPRGRGTEVHVLEGLVRAAVPGEIAARELHESQALRIEGRAATAMVADGTRFLTRLPPQGASPASYVHWSLDDGTGRTARAEGPLATAVAARLTSLQADDPGPAWIPGRFGSALDFDGAGDFVATDFGGISGGQARTVALWAKIPTDWNPINGFALVSWGTMQSPGAAWQISINPLPEDGPLGRLRAGVHTSQVIGTRDLRDGQWHHLAAVLFDGVGPRNTTHILLYIDGELEPAERKGIREVNTDVDRAGATAVTLGRNMDAHPRGGGRVFRGALDEIFIFDTALAREAIQRLMRRNAPPQHKPEANAHDNPN